MRGIVLGVPCCLAATAQLIYGTRCIRLATALLILISGVVYDRLGGSAFFAMAAVCVLAPPMGDGLRSSQMHEYPL